MDFSLSPVNKDLETPFFTLFFAECYLMDGMDIMDGMDDMDRATARVAHRKTP